MDSHVQLILLSTVFVIGLEITRGLISRVWPRWEMVFSKLSTGLKIALMSLLLYILLMNKTEVETVRLLAAAVVPPACMALGPLIVWGWVEKSHDRVDDWVLSLCLLNLLQTSLFLGLDALIGSEGTLVPLRLLAFVPAGIIISVNLGWIEEMLVGEAKDGN